MKVLIYKTNYPVLRERERERQTDRQTERNTSMVLNNTGHDYNE